MPWNPGDVVYQTDHGPDEGYYFEITEDRGGTVLATPLDRETRTAAMEEVIGPVQVQVEGEDAFDGQGQPIMQMAPTGEFAEREPIELNAEMITLVEA